MQLITLRGAESFSTKNAKDGDNDEIIYYGTKQNSPCILRRK
jgi:hypothetical protein